MKSSIDDRPPALMDKPFIHYGRDLRYFEPPPGWEILSIAAFEDRPPIADVADLTRRVLAKPVGALPLCETLSPQDTVAVIVEDLTRYSPKKAILPALLAELESIGVARKNIVIVIALGTHRELTEKELKQAFGEALVRDYPFINHDCKAGDLFTIGKLASGTPVRINRRVHAARFKIGIGSIFPHPMNGFGGGGKILFPGVSDFDAILEHHLKYSFRGGSALGKLQGNPFYEEVSRLARAGGLDFVINSVLDNNDRLYDLVCGAPVAAHLAGVEICRKIVSRRFSQKADLTVISAFPYTEGTQLMKPLAPAELITRPGGVIILAGRCTVPLPDIYIKGCERFRSENPGRLGEQVLGCFEKNRRILEEGAPEFNMSMAQALLAQDRFKVIFVCEDMPAETVERLGFLYAKDLDQAVAMGAAFLPAAKVHVVPAGGVILPVLDGAEAN